MSYGWLDCPGLNPRASRFSKLSLSSSINTPPNLDHGVRPIHGQLNLVVLEEDDILQLGGEPQGKNFPKPRNKLLLHCLSTLSSTIPSAVAVPSPTSVLWHLGDPAPSSLVTHPCVPSLQ